MRLKLANTLGNRDASTLKDERILNGLAEKVDEKNFYVTKRPATVSSYSLPLGINNATKGQALFVMNIPKAVGIASSDTLIGVRGDKLTTNP